MEIFPNAGGGYGFGVTKRTKMPEGYDRTLNMSVRDGDVLSPSFSYVRSSLPVAVTSSPPPTFAVAWQNAATQPAPVFLGAIGERVLSLSASGAAPFNEFVAANNAEVFGAAFHDDGLGVEYLYIGVSLALSYLSRRTQAGVWTTASGAGQLVTAKYLVSAAGALWRTTSDYQISKCPSGSNPFTLASWGAAIAVGTNYGQITALGALGAAPVVFRTDGIYAYNAADNIFENQFPVAPNPDNFPFARPDGAGGLYSAQHDGSIVHITRFGSISVEHPLKGKTPGRDTPRGPITDMAVWGDRIFAFMGPAYRLVQPPGLVVLKTTDSGATFTDYSAEVTDGNPATVADISSLPSAVNGGFLYVGFDQPVLAVQFVMNLFNSTVTNALAGELSIGQDTWIASTGLLYRGINDTQARVFGRSGIVSTQGVLATPALATYNTRNKFWLRLSVADALPANVTISSMAVVLQRPAPNFSPTLPFAPAFEASGMLAKILMATPKPGGLVWEDLYTLESSMTGGKLAITTLPTANSPGASLVAVTGLRLYQWPLPNILEPSVVEYPSLARDATGKMPPIFYPSAVDMETMHYLRYVEIIGADLVEGVDSWGFSWRWDTRNAWDNDKTGTGVEKATNALFHIDDQTGGRVLHTAIQLLDANATDAVGPTGRRIICWVEAVPIRPSGQVEPARAALEVA